MTVRRLLLNACALLALLLGGCGRGDSTPTLAEVDDPGYKQAKQLLRHGREQEALATFLRVIETRGSRQAAESHLEAGILYLHHLRNPVFAIYHFQTYLELRPTSPDAPRVRTLVATATREFAKTLPARPAESQSIRLEQADDLERLRRENEELRAQLATLRGGVLPLTRNAAAAVTPLNRTPAAPGGAAASPPPMITVEPTTQPAQGMPVLQPAPLPTPPRGPVANTAPRTQAASTTKAGAPTKSAPRGGRSYTVREKDGLWKIARDHYGANVNGAQVQAIFEANRDVMRDIGDLRPGMTLRIP